MRSSSSISSTGAPAGSGSSACSSGRLIRKRSENTSCDEPVAVDVALGLGEADRDHLRRIVPLIDRGGDVEPLVALQPDQPPPERRREHLGDLGLADAGLAFEKQRPPHAQREKQHGRERAVGEVFGRREQRQRRIDRGGNGRFGNGHEAAFRQDISGRSAGKREGPGLFARRSSNLRHSGAPRSGEPEIQALLLSKAAGFRVRAEARPGMTGLMSPSPYSGRAGWGLLRQARAWGSKSPALPFPKTGRERLPPARQPPRGAPARRRDGRDNRRCRGCRSQAVGRDRQPIERLRREALLQRLLERRDRGTRRRRRRRSPRRGPRSGAWRRTRRPARSARPGCGTSDRPPSSGSGTLTLVMISSGSSAVSNRPLKNSSATILRLVVTMVAPSAEAGGRIIRVGIVVGDRAADGAAVAHRRIADHRGELGERRDRLLHHRRMSRRRHGGSCAPITMLRPLHLDAARCPRSCRDR